MRTCPACGEEVVIVAEQQTLLGDAPPKRVAVCLSCEWEGV